MKLMDQLQQEYEDLFNLSPVGYFILDAEGNIKRVNRRGGFYLGIDAQLAEGMAFSGFLATQLHREEFLVHLSNVLQQGQIQRTESEFHSRDGAILPVLIKSAPVKDEENRIKHILTIVSDISNIKAHEHRMEAALMQEKRMNELKSSFVSIAAHEFRTPLSAVLSSASLVEQYAKLGSADKMQKHLDRIKSSVRTMVTILEEFLSLEKLESGNVEVVIDDFSLAEFCDDMIEEVRSVAKKGQHIHHVHRGPDLVKTDRNILQHILLNLLSNACKYSGEDQQIMLITEVSKEAVCIQVRDFGIGIPEKEHSKIFSRFFRATNVNAIQGTGLGLSIVKRYVELLNGTIHFTSRVNEGTTFTLKIA